MLIDFVGQGLGQGTVHSLSLLDDVRGLIREDLNNWGLGLSRGFQIICFGSRVG